MRRAAFAVVAAVAAAGGCELRPPPADRKQPRAPAVADEARPPAAATPDAAPEPAPDAAPGPGDLAAAVAAAAAAGEALAKRDPAQFKQCNAAAAHVTDVAIAMSPETSRPQLTLERPLRIQEMNQMCVEQSWSADALRCLSNAKDFTGIKRCSSLIAPAAGPAGSGSGSGS